MAQDIYYRALQAIRDKSVENTFLCPYAVTINFHPDRFTHDGRPLIEQIAHDGVLKSQFETQTSNGGLTAFNGGERWLWEQRVFGGVYDTCEAHQRPKYGALNFLESEYGAAPRFGSSYFRINRRVLERTSYCYPDSYCHPTNFATSSSVKSLVKMAQAFTGDELDRYVEAQIHGELNLAKDVEALVLDPSFKGTEVEVWANKLPCVLEWHSGYVLDVQYVNDNPSYRGGCFIELAVKLATNNKIKPIDLSRAIYQLNFDEQDIKKIWHYMANFGRLAR
ncbi:DUF3626 domain-containing protein [Vibrio europaeus]|uniref:DUF3626 domain-containing protein n=1 Tax=Vibrio europaeus TaxID=300876 RepID=UPI00233EC0C4|nr:DUF3626 domain-containing protein [Vibrio europaeus]MDC5855431.1 DUF3626 domain-containing protein [Vibrio europaeus]